MNGPQAADPVNFLFPDQGLQFVHTDTTKLIEDASGLLNAAPLAPVELGLFPQKPQGGTEASVSRSQDSMNEFLSVIQRQNILTLATKAIGFVTSMLQTLMRG